MKRFAVVLTTMFAMFAFMAMTSNVQAQETDLNMTVDLQEYIETQKTIDWNLATWHYDNFDVETVYGEGNSWLMGYANCPFEVSVSGSNPVDGDEYGPTFARPEAMNGSAVDRLESIYKIFFEINGEQKQIHGGYYGDDASDFPISGVIDEAPHDGEVRLNMSMHVNTPLTTGDFPNRTTSVGERAPEESADAGIYKASMQFTFSALNNNNAW